MKEHERAAIMSSTSSSANPSLSRISASDWEPIDRAFNEQKALAARIASLQGYSLGELRANVEAGISAGLHNISLKDARRLRDADNLGRFLSLCEKCRGECMNRIAGLRPPRPDDVDRVHASVQLRMKEELAKPVHGEAMKTLQSLHEDFIGKLLHFLHINMGRPPVQANSEQVEAAFVEGVQHFWKKQHQAKRYGLLLAQAAVLVLMSTHREVSPAHPCIGAAMLTAGILTGIFVLLYLAKKS
jgi:hypothetical protein